MRRENIIRINPIPASRPRVTPGGTYHLKKYANFRREMRTILSDIKGSLLEGTLYGDLVFHVGMPESWTKKKKIAKNKCYCDNNADIDNYCKAALDSFNGIYYMDDSQIVMLRARMFWATLPRIVCMFENIDTNDVDKEYNSNEGE